MHTTPTERASSGKGRTGGNPFSISSCRCCSGSRKIFFRLFLLPVCLALLFVYPGNSQAMKPFRIGTGGKTGVYYPVGKLIAMGLTRYAEQQDHSPLNGFIGVAQNSAGSIENAQGIISSELEAGLVQADIAAAVYRGEGNEKPSPSSSSIRAIASLYAEKFQIVVRNDAGVRNFFDLTGKSISIDEPGSGTLSVMRIILEAHGMKETDLDPFYLKPVFTQDKIEAGRIEGFVMMAGAPMEAVTELQATGVSLVPIEPAVAARIYRQYPYLFPGTIEADVYPGIPATPTVEVYALLVVNERMTDETAYALTEMLFSDMTSRLLHDENIQARAITLDTALNGVSIPLHPGARTFYSDRKMIE